MTLVVQIYYKFFLSTWLMKLVVMYLVHFISLGSNVVDVTCFILTIWFIIP